MDDIPKRNQNVYAVLLLLCSFVSVSLVTLLGTALPDLLCVMHTDLKSASFIFLGYGIGKCLLPLLGVFVNYASELPLLTTMALTIIAIFHMIVPNHSSLGVNVFTYSGIGFAGGIIDIARYALPAAIWEKSNVGFYFMSVGTGIATLATPLFTSLFVGNQTQNAKHDGNPCYSNIEFPFVSMSLVSMLTALGFAINNNSIVNQGKSLKDPNEIDHNLKFKSGTYVQKCFYVIVFIVFITITSCLTSIFSLMVTYGLRSKRHLDVETSSAMNSLFGICLLLARMFCVFIADRVKPDILFWASLLLTNTASTLFLIYKDSSVPLLWALSALNGFGSGPMFVTMVTWCKQYVPLSTRFLSTVLLMDNIGNVSHSTLTGVLMDIYGVDMFVYTIFGTRILQLALFFLLGIIVKQT